MRIQNFIASIIIAVLATAFSMQTAQAQPDLPAEQVEVIKIFEAQLAESEKVPLSPELPPVDTTIKKQTYDVPVKAADVEYPAPRIRPITFKTDDAEIPDAYKAYLKLGGGVPASVYGEGSFNHVQRRDDKTAYDVGLNVLHHSANFSDEEIENQRFGLTQAEAKGNYYFQEGYAVGGRLGYTSDRVSYYGYSADPLSDFPLPGQEIEKEDVKQLFSTFDLGARLFNGVQTAGDLNYSADLDFYTHADEFASNELGLNLQGKATKWIAGKHSFDLGLGTDFTWFNDTAEVSQTLHNFSLAPAFTFHGRIFRVKVGGKLISHEDEFSLFPDIEAVVNLTGNELALFAGVEGDLKKNTFRTLTDYNPYLHTRSPSLTILNTKYFHGYAGIRGNLKFFEYTVQAGFKPTNDLPLYLFRFEGDLIYDFEVIYDDVDIINVGGGIKASPIKGLDITGTMNVNIYDTKTQFWAWHLPVLETNFQVLYTTKDGKLRTKANFFLQDGVASNSGFGLARKDELKGLYDLSLGAEYWFGKHFGAFLDVNNLLDNKAERWRFYPTYGINVLGGISARF